MERIGLIAGNRKFPLLIAEAAKKKGCSVVAVAVKGETSPKIKKHADKVYWLTLLEFKRMFELFKAEGITKVIMAGQISPARIFSREVNKDAQLRDFLGSIKDKRADTIFGAIAARLEQEGLELLDSTIFVKEQMPKKGVLTRREPDFDSWEDIYFGFDLAKKIAYLDIGQTVSVKNKAVVAVEALEGTDNLILRSASIAGRGLAIIKVSKPKQDMRFDIPVVGLATVRNLAKVSARCLAIEAEKTLFIDREESVKLADKRGIAIVAV